MSTMGARTRTRWDGGGREDGGGGPAAWGAALDMYKNLTRTCNEGFRPWCLSPDVFKKKITLKFQQSWC